MTLWQCDKHGANPIALVCPHIYAAYITQQVPGDIVHVVADFDEQPGWAVYLCDVCIAVPGVMTEDDKDRRFETIFAIDQMPVCPMCFDQWRARHTTTPLLTEDQKAELDRRASRTKAEEQAGITWEQLKKRYVEPPSDLRSDLY